MNQLPNPLSSNRLFFGGNEFFHLQIPLSVEILGQGFETCGPIPP